MSFWLKVGVITDGARGVDVTAGEVIVWTQFEWRSGSSDAVYGGWACRGLLREIIAQ
jgi:hypothetical protein